MENAVKQKPSDDRQERILQIMPADGWYADALGDRAY